MSSLLVLGFVGYFLYTATSDSQNPKKLASEAAQSDIGLLDMKKVMKVHPKYQELVQLKKELNTILAEKQSMQEAVRKNRLPDVDSAAINQAVGPKSQQEFIAKRDQLNQQLKYKDEQLQKQLKAQLQEEIDEINANYLPSIFDVKLKLDTLKLSDEARNELQQKHQQLEVERKQKIALQEQKAAEKHQTIMQSEVQKSMQELNGIKAQGEEKQQGNVADKTAQIQERNTQEMAKQEQSDKFTIEKMTKGKAKIIELEKQIAALEEEIKADIAGKTAKFAIRNKLSLVLTGEMTNVNAVDITEQVIAEFKNL